MILIDLEGGANLGPHQAAKTLDTPVLPLNLFCL